MTSALLLVAAAVLGAACGTTDQARVEDATSAADTVSSPAADQDAADSGAEADPWSTVVAFNEALVAQNWAGAAALAEPESLAAEYVEYRMAVAEAQQAAGDPDTSTGTVTGDESSGTVTVTLSADDDEVVYAWDGFEVGDGGLVSTWSTSQGPLSDVLTSPGTSGEGAGATVTWTHAYVTTDGRLYVTVRVEAQDDLITPDDSLGIRIGSDTVASSSPVGTTEIDAGSTAPLLYRADVDTLPDGLVYEVQNTFDAPVAVQLTR